MIAIEGYEFSDQLYQSTQTIVYRGHRQHDLLPVVAKIQAAEYPSPKTMAKFRREYELGSQLNLPSIIQYYDRVRYKGDQAIIIEDFGAVALAELIPPNGMDIPSFLRVATILAQALGAIHALRIIHKDVKPRNIVVHPHTYDTKLIDFGIASQLPRENQMVLSPNRLEGTLAYMSPEQTGRMNRSLDYRTDFYSLGVTFYEMLTGTLPFDADDAIELIHCHIARAPLPPSERRPEVPKALCDIVAKLIAKNAESRYQSASGLIADLQRCQDTWQARGAIGEIAIGQHDVSNRFEIP